MLFVAAMRGAIEEKMIVWAGAGRARSDLAPALARRQALDASRRGGPRAIAGKPVSRWKSWRIFHAGAFRPLGRRGGRPEGIHSRPRAVRAQFPIGKWSALERQRHPSRGGGGQFVAGESQARRPGPPIAGIPVPWPPATALPRL